jgi:hypothetical protein
LLFWLQFFECIDRQRTPAAAQYLSVVSLYTLENNA